MFVLCGNSSTEWFFANQDNSRMDVANRRHLEEATKTKRLESTI
jgi:hypothetical protein